MAAAKTAMVLAKLVAVSDLQPAPWNPRTIKDERFADLCASISADPGFLWLRPILATIDGTVLAGNMRLRAAQNLGMESIPAILLDVPERLARERALRDNGQWGAWEAIPAGTLKKTVYQAEVVATPEGIRYRVNETEYRSPSAAASAIMGGIACNGSFQHQAAEMMASAESLDLRIIGELIQRWQDIRLAELAAGRFGDELGGRHLLHARVVALPANCREPMLTMRDALADPDRQSVYEFELPEPTRGSPGAPHRPAHDPAERQLTWRRGLDGDGFA